MKTQHLIRILLLTLFAACLPATLSAQDAVVHYDNADGNWATGSVGLFYPFNRDEKGPAQKFTAGEIDRVTSVTLVLAQFNSPGGKLIVSVREVDETTGNPGDVIGTLGEIEIDSLPPVVLAELNSATVVGILDSLETVSVEGLVTGLVPGDDYYLVVQHSEDANVSVDGTSGQTWFFAMVDRPGDADLALGEDQTGWIVLWPPAGRLYARIEGTFPAPELRIQRAVQISWPEFGSADVLERASSPEGPWEAVTEAMQTVDGENRITIVTDTYNAYFRLRRE